MLQLLVRHLNLSKFVAYSRKLILFKGGEECTSYVYYRIPHYFALTGHFSACSFHDLHLTIVSQTFSAKPPFGGQYLINSAIDIVDCFLVDIVAKR